MAAAGQPPAGAVAVAAPRARKCSKANAVLAHGSRDDVLTEAEYAHASSGGRQSDLETEWRKYSRPARHTGSWCPSPCRQTCAELGACQATDSGRRAVKLAAAATKWLYQKRPRPLKPPDPPGRTAGDFAAGSEFWAVLFQREPGSPWHFFGEVPVLLVAHALWNPRRCVVAAVQWVEPVQDLQLDRTTWPRQGGLTSPVGTLESIEFMLLPTCLAKLIATERPVAWIPEAASLRDPLRVKSFMAMAHCPVKGSHDGPSPARGPGWVWGWSPGRSGERLGARPAAAAAAARRARRGFRQPRPCGSSASFTSRPVLTRSASRTSAALRPWVGVAHGAQAVIMVRPAMPQGPVPPPPPPPWSTPRETNAWREKSSFCAPSAKWSRRRWRTGRALWQLVGGEQPCRRVRPCVPWHVLA